MNISLKKAALLVALLFLFVHGGGVASAQSGRSLLEQRLCRTWKFDYLTQDGKTVKADKSLADFVIIISLDHTIKQGMYPDGLIGGKWKVDEKEMILDINDETTSQQYRMKIFSVTTDELVLQDPAAASPSFLHYRAE